MSMAGAIDRLGLNKRLRITERLETILNKIYNYIHNECPVSAQR